MVCLSKCLKNVVLLSMKIVYVETDSTNPYAAFHPRPHHTRIQKVLSEGVQFRQPFFVEEMIEEQNTAGHHRLASETPSKLRFAGVPMKVNIECWLGFSGNLDQYCYGTIYFCVSSGGGPLSPSGSAHVFTVCERNCLLVSSMKRVKT